MFKISEQGPVKEEFSLPASPRTPLWKGTLQTCLRSVSETSPMEGTRPMVAEEGPLRCSEDRGSVRRRKHRQEKGGGGGVHTEEITLFKSRLTYVFLLV